MYSWFAFGNQCCQYTCRAAQSRWKEGPCFLEALAGRCILKVSLSGFDSDYELFILVLQCPVSRSCYTPGLLSPTNLARQLKKHSPLSRCTSSMTTFFLSTQQVMLERVGKRVGRESSQWGWGAVLARCDAHECKWNVAAQFDHYMHISKTTGHV